MEQTNISTNEIIGEQVSATPIGDLQKEYGAVKDSISSFVKTTTGRTPTSFSYETLGSRLIGSSRMRHAQVAEGIMSQEGFGSYKKKLIKAGILLHVLKPDYMERRTKDVMIEQVLDSEQVVEDCDKDLETCERTRKNIAQQRLKISRGVDLIDQGLTILGKMISHYETKLQACETSAEREEYLSGLNECRSDERWMLAQQDRLSDCSDRYESGEVELEGKIEELSDVRESAYLQMTTLRRKIGLTPLKDVEKVAKTVETHTRTLSAITANVERAMDTEDRTRRRYDAEGIAEEPKEEASQVVNRALENAKRCREDGADMDLDGMRKPSETHLRVRQEIDETRRKSRDRLRSSQTRMYKNLVSSP